MADCTIANVLSATAGDRLRTGDNERICATREGEGLRRAIVVGISSNNSRASVLNDSSKLSPMIKHTRHIRILYFLEIVASYITCKKVPFVLPSMNFPVSSVSL